MNIELAYKKKSARLKYLIILYLTANPIFFWVGRELRLVQESFWQVAATMLIMAGYAFFGHKPARFNRLSTWICIFGLYSCVLFLLGGMRLGSVTMLNTFLGILVYLLALRLDKKDTSAILTAIVIVGCVNTLYMALQILNFDFIFNLKGPGNLILRNISDPFGFMGIKCAMGIYKGLSMMAALFFSPFWALLFLAPIAMSESTAAWLAAGTGLAFYWYWMKRRLFRLIIIPLVIVGFCYTVFYDMPKGMFGTRPPLWKMALKDTVYGFNLHNDLLQPVFLRNPLTGFGLDAFYNGSIRYFTDSQTYEITRTIRIKDHYIDSESGVELKRNSKGDLLTMKGNPADGWAEIHCEPIQIFYDMGLIGLVIVGFGLWEMKQRFSRAIKTKEFIVVTAMLLVFFISSLTQFPLRMARISSFFPILLGLFVVNSAEG